MVRIVSLLLLMSTQAVWANQDPTAPLGWMVPNKQASKPVKKNTIYRLPRLQSIVCKGELPCYTVLDNQIHTQGEVVRGYRIKEINPEYVTLQRSSKQWKLELFSLDIKK